MGDLKRMVLIDTGSESGQSESVLVVVCIKGIMVEVSTTAGLTYHRDEYVQPFDDGLGRQ